MFSCQQDVKTLSNNYLLRNFIWYPPRKQIVARSDEDVQNRFTAGLSLYAAFYDFDGVLSSCFVGTRSFLLLVVEWWIWLLVLAAYFFCWVYQNQLCVFLCSFVVVKFGLYLFFFWDFFHFCGFMLWPLSFVGANRISANTNSKLMIYIVVVAMMTYVNRQNPIEL